MTTYIALLRGINVGGNVLVPMAALRELLTGMGLAEVRTLLQSGNVVFQAPARGTAGLETAIEAEIEKHLGHRPAVLVRTAAEWREIIARNPFPKEAKTAPGYLIALCLKKAPTAAQVKALQAAIVGREVVRARGREAYIVYPDGVGRSKLTNTLIEKTLATRATARNWNTVLKLGALCG
jgi:uncharacterized protein (DUF1697 family)